MVDSPTKTSHLKTIYSDAHRLYRYKVCGYHYKEEWLHEFLTDHVELEQMDP